MALSTLVPLVACAQHMQNTLPAGTDRVCACAVRAEHTVGGRTCMFHNDTYATLAVDVQKTCETDKNGY